MSDLVLSLFPGIGLFDKAFEDEGFCVVRGPDVLWGGDIRHHHPPAGRFDGVIGGPPCQMFSALAPLVRHNGHEPRFGNLIPEFERCVGEAAPAWFVMENVRGAPLPNVPGYDRWATLLKDSDVGGVQPRVRRISMGFREGLWTAASSPFALVEYDTTNTNEYSIGTGRPTPRQRDRSVTGDARAGSTGSRLRRESDGGGGTLPHVGASASVASMLEAQGLPPDYLDHAPFTVQGKRQAIGNGVPLAMGRAIARAVKLAIS